ncbi:MAG: cation:proton antiporter, partial [Candidatus Aenigmarchaeota archaeon]|nr:cation:proton antiporter [Candidatus Aenigmarchaeota archaeon]
GFILGPHGLALITNEALITALSEIGIALLLFTVGMEMDLTKLKNVGKIASIGSILQLILTASGGFILAISLGFTQIESVYIALIVSFSSTMIAIKLLSDKEQLDTLSGRISVGILLAQDVIVVLAMSFMQNITNISLSILGLVIFKAIGLFAIALVLNKFIFPQFLKKIVKDKELVFLVTLSICFIFGAVSYILGFSIAVGGFLAGISLAVFPYNLDISSRVKPLRDFFTILFFGSLGLAVSFSNMAQLIVPLVALSLFVIFGKFIIISVVSAIFGYKKRVSIFTGLYLSNISEFSLILVGVGYALGHVSLELVSISTLLALITITVTSYTIKYDESIQKTLRPLFSFVDGFRLFKHNYQLSNVSGSSEKLKNHVIIIGAHTMGQTIIDNLVSKNMTFIVIDYNPEIVKKLISNKQYCIYGDVAHFDVLDDAGIKQARLVISTIPRMEDNAILIERTKMVNPKAKTILTSNTIDEALKLYSLGAGFVIIPKLVSANKVGDFLKDTFTKNNDSLELLRKHELKYLERKEDEKYLNLYEPEYLKALKKKIDEK